eukprot:CAMPEP_0202891792 /NCGR_PEP_ID=MMETSP1392-20130828/1760_1 /ASSEMBLY_ACC=CAM_ASM_000868 /TAXON_ID=225041 /ORGANISM="Chlamydomonas chlamydogama, Strain SAG 11-48b" /LENGTH=34 /DNA_ID= /DNA_START= /DNA_END= /DNA_ORIENTATION=
MASACCDKRVMQSRAQAFRHLNNLHMHDTLSACK